MRSSMPSRPGALHRGREADASELLVEAQRQLPLLTHLCPVPAVQARLELARAHLLLEDHANASAMSEEIEGVLRRCPDLGRSESRPVSCGGRLGAPGHDVPGPPR